MKKHNCNKLLILSLLPITSHVAARVHSLCSHSVLYGSPFPEHLSQTVYYSASDDREVDAVQWHIAHLLVSLERIDNSALLISTSLLLYLSNG